MGKIVVVDAVRSAVGRAKKGSLANRRPDELAGEVIRGLMARNPEVDPNTVEDLVLGCAFPEGEQGMNVARMEGRVAVVLLRVRVDRQVVDQVAGVPQHRALPVAERRHLVVRAAGGDQLDVRVDHPHQAGGLGGQPAVLLRGLVADLPRPVQRLNTIP